jgi:hypothetical protein
MTAAPSCPAIPPGPIRAVLGCGTWPGWRDLRAYESLERELRLTATHDGHVRLAVFLRQSSVPDGWSAAVIRLDPGEELTRVAGEVSALLVPPES